MNLLSKLKKVAGGAVVILSMFGTSAASARPDFRTEEVTVRCDSEHYEFNHCRVRGDIVDAWVTEQKSRADCRYRDSWGFDDRGLWVDEGCAAVFTVKVRVRSNRPDRDRREETLTCKSEDYNYNRCWLRGEVDRVNLLDTLSDTNCRRGRNWGYTNDYIWVDRGCEGRFVVRYR